MPIYLAILILLAPALTVTGAPQEPAAAATAARTPFPSDFQRSSVCAAPGKVCKSFNQSQFSSIAGLRGFDIGQEWVDSHWNELVAALAPACERVGACYAAPGNTFTFCNDNAVLEARPVCDRYPAGSQEREKCRFFVDIYLAGVDRHSPLTWKELQDCAKSQLPAERAERTLDYWMEPSTLQLDGLQQFRVYTLDSETRVPVQALLKIQSSDPVYADDAPSGLPTTFYEVKWQPRLLRVPNQEGHRDVVAPQVTVLADGYRSETFTLPVEIPRMKVTMKPSLRQLKPGKHQVTVAAHDARTGQPVEARVMGGHFVLGKTNEPFELVIKAGSKAPEIWVTSLYDRYSDVVVR